MRRRIYLLLLISVFILFLNYISADDSVNQDIDITMSQNQETYSNFYKYPDVFYPPEEELLKQGMILSTYKQSLKENAKKNRNSSVANIWGTTPLSGTVRIPVLLVQFSDKLPTYTQTQISDFFNYPTIQTNSISVSKYYNVQSYGDLNLVFDVYDWTTMPQTFAHYSATSENEFQLIIDAYYTFVPVIDFAQYDNDDDGRIDGVVIIYSDYSQNSGILPHTRILNNYIVEMADGKYFGNAALVPEKGRIGINIFERVIAIHEFAHVFGLPDLYATGAGGQQLDSGPVNGMSMMIYQDGACNQKPINLDVWSRYFLGWITPKVLTTFDDKNQSLRSVSNFQDAVILKNSNLGEREFFIVENRQRTSSSLDKCMFNNAATTYGGFAIYHVDENKIEYDYEDNKINFDDDGYYLDDTISWPGLLFEQNIGTGSSTTYLNPNREDFYHIGIYGAGSNSWNKAHFNENMYGPVNLFDLTTRSYNGTLNPLIRFQALTSANQPIMSATMLIGEDTEPPTINLENGSYSEGTEFIISTTTPNSIIYYTIDGTNPNFESLSIENGSSIILPVGNTTLKYMAKGEKYYVSGIYENTYTIIGSVANLIANIPSGEVNYGTEIILQAQTPETIIRYTLDNSEPTEESMIYNSPIIITQNTIIKAKGFKENYNPSETLILTYTLQAVVTPQASHLSGILDYRTLVALTTTTSGATIRFTTNGSEPTINSIRYTNPFYVINPITLKIRAFKDGYQPSAIATYNYQIKLPTPRTMLESGEYSFLTRISIISNSSQDQIYYTTDGSDPNDGQQYTGSIRLTENMYLRAIAKRNGFIDSEILEKEYTLAPPDHNTPKILLDPKTPKIQGPFELIYITQMNWSENVRFSIDNINGCTFDLTQPAIYTHGRTRYYVFGNNECERGVQRRATFIATDRVSGTTSNIVMPIADAYQYQNAERMMVDINILDPNFLVDLIPLNKKI